MDQLVELIEPPEGTRTFLCGKYFAKMTLFARRNALVINILMARDAITILMAGV